MTRGEFSVFGFQFSAGEAQEDERATGTASGAVEESDSVAPDLALDGLDEPERYELHEAPRYQFQLDRRDVLKTIGGGIVVFLVLRDSPAQAQRGRGLGGRGNVPQELAAWLHVDEEGTIEVYCGKTEIGQNVRTSLSQAVTEELRVPMESVRMVLADTDLVPFDAGTFGSRSTPAMLPQIRRVGAAAREMLIDLAAEALEVGRSTLTAADGIVRHSASGRSLTYAELARDKKLTKTVAANVALTPPAQWKVIGKPALKVNARDIVTGRHQYSSDVIRPGMLHGKVLRPPSMNAKLVSADVEKARSMDGVSVVRDGEFVGVAAPSQHAAEQALDAIGAEWTSPRESSVATLYDDLKIEGGGGRGGFGGRGGQNTGSIDDGLAAADHKLSATYTIAYIAHTPLEPRAAVAEWNDGKLTVWTGTQRPFGVRGDLAQAFGIGQERVRVIVPDTGSGYGGKHTGEAAIEAARLAKSAGKPVKLVWSREEEFTWAYFRPAGVIEVSAGVKSDGTITAWEFHNYNSGGSAIEAPYRVANVRTATHNSRSPLRQGSYRALASTANVFARECHIDDLAHAANIDPLEFRLKNLRDAGVRAVVEAAAKKFGWGDSKPPADHGYGIAGGTEKGSCVATCAEVAIDRADGTVRVVRLVTAFECGAVVNPLHLENQVEGAVMMGLGGALFEHIEYTDGVITNARLSDYRVPRFSDLPKLETVLLDRKDLPSAGAGETPIVAVAPAIGNAIFNAVGVRLCSLPMVPEGLKV